MFSLLSYDDKSLSFLHPGFQPSHPQAKKMAKAKQEPGSGVASSSRAAGNHALGMPMATFRDYDLKEMGIPLEARCREGGVYQGQHGYTVVSSNGAELRCFNWQMICLIWFALPSVGEHDNNAICSSEAAKSQSNMPASQKVRQSKCCSRPGPSLSNGWG